MRQFYEDLWRRLPDELDPPEWDRRLGLLLGELRGGDRVLDLGCGEGAFAGAAAQALNGWGGGAAGAAPAPPTVVGAEVAQAAVDRARRAHPGLDFRLVPFDGPLPFDDTSFDLVWASEVIEHVADTALWCNEIRRVLTPAGRLLLTTPAHGRLRLALGGIERYSPPLGDHLHLYSARSLQTLLDELGFREVRVWAASGPPTLRRTLFARAIR